MKSIRQIEQEHKQKKLDKVTETEKLLIGEKCSEFERLDMSKKTRNFNMKASITNEKINENSVNQTFS